MSRSRNFEKHQKYKQPFNNKQNNNNNIKCYNCGRRGHIASKCRERRREEEHVQKTEKKSFSILASTVTNGTLTKNTWCLDSGATAHLCCDRTLFVSFRHCSEKIMLAGNNFLEASGIGTVRIYHEGSEVDLLNVLYVRELQSNFISVSKAIEKGFRAIFEKEYAYIKDHENNVIIKAVKNHDLFLVDNNTKKCFIADTNAVTILKWHNRFGHLNLNSLKEMATKNFVYGLKASDFRADFQQCVCLTCAKSKICVKPFPQKSNNRAKDVLELVHTDICGPINKPSAGGSRYFATFIDDNSRFVFVYLLKSKDQIFEAFKDLKALAEKQTNKKLKAIPSDNGREYLSNAFEQFLKENGIKRQLTVAYTPQQNGVAERANRTIVEMARSMLVHAGMEESFWAEAVRAAAYLRNRSRTQAVADKTPYEAWTGQKPSVKHLRVFGSKAIALDKTQTKKFRPKGVEHIMIGYSDRAKAYRLYNPESRKVIESRDVIFIENSNKQQSVNDLVSLETKNVDDQPVEELKSQQSQELVDETSCHSNEVNKTETADPDDEEKQRGPGRPKILRTGEPGRPRKEYQVLNVINADHILVPQSVKETMSTSYADNWRTSMRNEYDALVRNGTWSLVDLPKEKKAIGCKWVFAVKKDKDGNVQRFKSRLVAKGCAQRFGINYSETFSPVVRYSSIRLIIAIAVERNMYLHQMDVSSAYLNSELTDEIYMRQPETFENKDHPERVLKLYKSLYGLKQSGREWNSKLNAVLIKIGFVSCASEPCVYTRNTDSSTNIIAVYVDDLIFASTNYQDLIDIKTRISNEFDVVDGGALKHFLGMEIERQGETGEVTIGQKQFIKNLLCEYGMSDCKTVATPLETGFQVKCDNDKCQKVDQTKYQSLIGSLMYLAMSTRPDIFHSVVKLAQRNTDPHSEHEVGAKRILRYLKGTAEMKLHYIKTGQPIYCYVDADWAGDSSDRKSFTGFVFVAAGSVVSWESKKQSLVALSSTEAEYVALSVAAKEAVYIKKLYHEMGLGEIASMMINSDNQSAQCLVKNPTFHSRSKHIDIKYHYVGEAYKNNIIKVRYVPTHDMIADVLTKNLCKIKHEKFIYEMGLF